MGETFVSVRVSGPRGEAVLRALVDTGATFTKVPPSVAENIGLQPYGSSEVMLSDGSKRSRKMALATVELDGAWASQPISIGGGGEQPIVGYTTLEILGFKVDPVTGRLERRPPIEL